MTAAMSRLMRRGRREIPSPLNLGRAPAAIIDKGEFLSPRRLLSPRQFFTPTVPIQATPLPTPIASILTTTKFETVTPTSLPTATLIPTTLTQPQIPTPTDGSSIAPMATLQADQSAVGGGDASTAVANVAQGSNMPAIAGVAGAGKQFSQNTHFQNQPARVY